MTGASSGIGATVAGALGRAGAHVHLVGRDPARLGAVAAASEAAAVHTIDLTDEGAIVAARYTEGEQESRCAERVSSRAHPRR